MPNVTLEDEALRMQRAAAAIASFNKLTHAGLVDEIEGLAARLRPLLPDMFANWQEFDTICAQLRGYAFHTFKLSHRLYMQQFRCHTSATSPTTLAELGLEDL